MSRQFDEFIDSHFEYNGEYHELVEPTDASELAEAFRTRDMIQECINRGAEGYERYLEEQEHFIEGYLRDLGEYENALLTKNVTFLLKKSGLRIGDLEEAVGLSAGYISRTSKPGAVRKMSIDSVWKIARLFGVTLHQLLETELDAPSTNTALVSKLVDKLILQTDSGEIEWYDNTPTVAAFSDWLEDTGVITRDNPDYDRVYHPDHLNKEMTWVLDYEVMGCENAAPDRTIAYIVYKSPDRDQVYYDFFLVNLNRSITNPDEPVVQYEPLFYSSDDPFSDLAEKCKQLHELVDSRILDTRLSKDAKSWIKDYLS